jgi:hypothetical protein
MGLSGATELYLLERSRVPLMLSPDSAGTPTVIHPQPLLFRAAYLGADELETGVAIARATLASKHYFLFAPLDCPDGPPYRSCLMFAFLEALNGMPWQDGPMIYHGYTMLKYGPATAQARWNWLDDARMGRYGYFLTGTVGDDSLWRLFRLETDAFQRSVFTLAPVRLAAGCPQADFSSVSIPLLAQELTAQYGDLCRSVQSHSYRDVVTKARNIVEGLVWGRLGAVGGRDLFADLKTVISRTKSG